MSSANAFAKINLALLIGPRRQDGKHEVATVLQRIDLHDDVEVERADGAGLSVDGFAEDTLVRRALDKLSTARGESGGWRAHIEKRIPVASGLGGGSSDAAAALRLANELMDDPLEPGGLHALATELGSDVPFFLAFGAQLARGDGTDLSPLVLPEDYAVLLALPHGERKESTAAVYRSVDATSATAGFELRRRALLETLQEIDHPAQLAVLPWNELASSPLAFELMELGAFRADVSGAGPTVYGLFEDERDARRAEQTIRRDARTWLVHPVSGP